VAEKSTLFPPTCYAKIFLKWTRFLHWAAFVFLNKPNNKKLKMFTVNEQKKYLGNGNLQLILDQLLLGGF
jgi:hypothetical protein